MIPMVNLILKDSFAFLKEFRLLEVKTIPYRYNRHHLVLF